MNKLFLLDAYALIYRAYYAFIRNPRINSKGVNTSAVFGFVNTLEDVLKREQPTHIGVAFDPAGPTFRHESYAQYKAQREETPEDIKRSVPIIKKIIEAYGIPILEVAGYEADDVIGTLATLTGNDETEVYMMTPDKDYGQLVKKNVYIYRPKSNEKGFEVLGEQDVCEKYGLSSPCQMIDLLGLMGDASDNIPGCPGVGEKTARKLLDEFGSIDQLLQNTDKLKGALQKKVKEHSEMIRFSRFLATIKTDVPIEPDMERLDRKKQRQDQDTLRTLFEELEFRTMIERVLGNTVSAPVQRSLFDDPEPGKEQNETETTSLTQYNQEIQYYQTVDTTEALEKLIALLRTKDAFCFDTETTGLDPITAQLVGISFCNTPDKAFYIPVPDNQAQAEKIVNKLKPLFEDPTIRKIGQNIKYDILMLKKYGVAVQGELFDTMVAHYLLQPELKHNMDYLAEIYLNYKTIAIEELIGPKGKNQLNMRQVSNDKITVYAAEDADITFKLQEKLAQELDSNNLNTLFYQVEMPLIYVLANMEFCGVRIDGEALKTSSSILAQEMAKIEQTIYQLAGKEFNIGSPRQVGEILFDKLKLNERARKTKSGQYSTSEETLESMKHKHPIIEQILNYRGLKKLLSTYIDALPALVNPSSHKIHTSFNQTVTATGRLSSSNPNLQNIPIRDAEGKEIRKAFIPDEGCLFFSADYSQIELRIMAHLSNDAGMIEAFRSGHDIHAATAAAIYKLPIEEVTVDMRRKAKTANFGIIYGISAFGLAERLGIDRKEAKKLIDDYFATYPDIKNYMDECIRVAQEKGYVETLFHRKRILSDINSRNSFVRGYAERNAINAPIQGSAADIIKVAMVNIQQRFEKEGIRSQMILQVHDELNFNVYPDEKERVQQIVVEEMENACPLQVPLKADYGWGQNWLEAH